jgi:hypothetical protein
LHARDAAALGVRRCTLAFCTECRQAWHGLSPCADLATRWRAADEDGREALRKRYGDHVLHEVESSSWVRENTKACPRCGAATQKNGGCNHIQCQSCRHEWCWLCTATYKVGHYQRGACQQFSQDFFDELNMSRETFERNFTVVDHF